MNLQDYLRFLPNDSGHQQSPEKSVWLTYDSEADVLYVNYKKPIIATELSDDDVIIEEVIGFTVLHVTER